MVPSASGAKEPIPSGRTSSTRFVQSVKASEAIEATPDGITIIPVSRISYAFASGGSDFRVKDKPGFGGGNGAGVKIEPIGFLVVRDGNVRMVSITPPASNTIDRVIEKAPELMDTVERVLKKRSGEDAE